MEGVEQVICRLKLSSPWERLFLKAQLDSVAPAHHFSSFLSFLQGLWHSVLCAILGSVLPLGIGCVNIVSTTYCVCVPVYVIANVKLCQSSWPYGTHGSAAVCWGTSRLQYMVNTPDWSILYLECMFTTSHVPVLMLTCTHRPTYTISFFFSFLKVGHTAIGLSLVVGQEGEGVGALKHTCLSKDAPLLTDHWGGELVCQSCRKLNWLWQVESSRASENAFMSYTPLLCFWVEHELFQYFILGQENLLVIYFQKCLRLYTWMCITPVYSTYLVTLGISFNLWSQGGSNK